MVQTLLHNIKISGTLLPMFLVSLCASDNSFLHMENVDASAQSQSSGPTGGSIIFGAWVPSEFHLEDMTRDQQRAAIQILLGNGFREYYFVMKDYANATEVKTTEELLRSADGTGLGILIILLPPSEGGSSANYHWRGWIDYFNSLKSKHQSFLGFAIDDFNASGKTRRVYHFNNVDRMNLTGLPDALSHKREDVQFYPVMYLETGEFETVGTEYNKYTTGLILVSTLYQNITYLESQLIRISEMFHDEPIKFIIYPTKSSDHSPSDRLMMATLSVASRRVDGLIMYVDTDHYVIRDYLRNYNDPLYMSALREMERLQIADEIAQPLSSNRLAQLLLYYGTLI